MASDTMAGPGHIPASPHPAPNIAPPATSLVSMTRLVGMAKDAPHTGVFRTRCTAANPGATATQGQGKSRAKSCISRHRVMGCRATQEMTEGLKRV